MLKTVEKNAENEDNSYKKKTSIIDTTENKQHKKHDDDVISVDQTGRRFPGRRERPAKQTSVEGSRMPSIVSKQQKESQLFKSICQIPKDSVLGLTNSIEEMIGHRGSKRGNIDIINTIKLVYGAKTPKDILKNDEKSFLKIGLYDKKCNHCTNKWPPALKKEEFCTKAKEEELPPLTSDDESDEENESDQESIQDVIIKELLEKEISANKNKVINLPTTDRTPSRNIDVLEGPVIQKIEDPCDGTVEKIEDSETVDNPTIIKIKDSAVDSSTVLKIKNPTDETVGKIEVGEAVDDSTIIKSKIWLLIVLQF